MKTTIITILAAFIFCAHTIAQNNTFSKSAMVTLVSGARDTYKKGMTCKDWINVLVGSTNTTILTANENKLLNDIYGYLTTSATPETIFQTYDGASFIALAQEKSKPGTGAFDASNQRCGWCQFLRWLLFEYMEWQFPMP